MDLGVRSPTQMLWGKEFTPELDIDHPDHARSPVDLPVQGFKNVLPMKKLETAEKKWLVSALPWSYADVVKKPSNRRPKQRKDNRHGEAADSSASSTSEQEWNNVKEGAEQNIKKEEENLEENDKDKQLNPDATEFVPGTPPTKSGEETDTSDEVKTTEETNAEEIREMPEQDIKQLFSEHDDVFGNEPTDGSTNEEYPETDVPERKLSPSVQLVDLSPNEVDFNKDHFGKDKLSIEPFETVTSSTVEANFTPKPDLIQDVTSKRELSKYECVSFGNKLNFEELVKKKCTYSENHFGNNEPELTSIESFQYCDDKVEQSNQENESREREEQLESHPIDDSCLDQEYFANSNDRVDEQCCLENIDTMDVISEECDSFNNPTSDKKMEDQSEEILESTSLFANLNENNECDLKEIDEMEGHICEPSSNDIKNEYNGFEETEVHDDVINTNELNNYVDTEVNEEVQNADETGPIDCCLETVHLNLGNQTQMSSENRETDECTDEHFNTDEVNNSDELIKHNEVEEECQDSDESEPVENLELENHVGDNNSNIPFDDVTEEDEENVYNASISHISAEALLAINRKKSAENEDGEIDATRDDMMSRSMTESPNHDSSFELINETPSSNDDVSDDYYSKRNYEERGDKTSDLESGTGDEFDNANFSQENETRNEEMSFSSLKKMDDIQQNETEGVSIQMSDETHSFALDEKYINKNDELKNIIDSSENKEFHSDPNMLATEVSDFNRCHQENETNIDESISESHTVSTRLVENRTENQELVSEKDCDENVSCVFIEEQTSNTEVFSSEPPIPEAVVESDLINCSQENEGIYDKTLENQIENQDYVNENDPTENDSPICGGECINETNSLDSETKNQVSNAGEQNETTNTEDNKMEIINKASEDESYVMVEVSDANGNKLEDISAVAETAEEMLNNNENNAVVTAAAITSVAVGAIVAAGTVESKKKGPEPLKKGVKATTDDKVAVKPLTSAAGKKPTSSKPPTSKPTLPSKASPAKPSSPLKSKEQATTLVKGKPKDTAPVKGKPTTPDIKSTSVSTASKPLAKVSPTTPNKTSQSTKTSDSITKSVPTAKPAASPAKPAASKTVLATKPSTPPVKMAPSSSKPTTTKTTTKPTTPPAAKSTSGLTKTVPTKPLTPTKTAATVNKAPPTKPPTPLTKTAPTKAVAKPTAGVKPSPAKPTVGVATAASPKSTLSAKPGTPTSKSSGGETKSSTKVAPPAKPTSATSKSPQPIKKPASTTKQPASSTNDSSVPKSNATKVTTTSTTKTGPMKQPSTGPNALAKQAPVDKSKSLKPSKPADKPVPNKKAPANKKITEDKNAKNVAKLPAKEATKTSPDITEEETVSSTTDYPPIENGNLQEINELPPQIIV